MAKLISSDGSQGTRGSGVTSTKYYSYNGGNTGIANGRNNTIATGYNGYVVKRIKSRGQCGKRVQTKNFGRERRCD